MKVYLVGGAVRDELMGLEPKDRDYVVVGATHEKMISMGFIQVGASFPVYLHRESKEEYALARTEISTGPGYHDFEVVFNDHVTIEEDLARRDLTINAIAKDLETGEYIDPFGGIFDIERGKLYAVSEKTFFEDPLRIYRLARFYARHSDRFQISWSALQQCEDAKHNLASLPNERKVAELKKCFEDTSLSNKPSKMIEFLTTMGEFPELEILKGIPQPEKHHAEGDPFIHTMMVIEEAKKNANGDARIIWSALCHDLGKVCYNKFGNLYGHEQYGVSITKSLCERFGVPNSWRNLAGVVTEYHGRMHKVMDMKPRKVYDLLRVARGEKDPAFAEAFAKVCLSDAMGRIPARDGTYPQYAAFMSCLAELKENSLEISVASTEIAEKFSQRPQLIQENIRSLKTRYVAKALKETKDSLKEGK